MHERVSREPSADFAAEIPVQCRRCCRWWLPPVTPPTDSCTVPHRPDDCCHYRQREVRSALVHWGHPDADPRADMVRHAAVSRDLAGYGCEHD